MPPATSHGHDTKRTHLTFNLWSDDEHQRQDERVNTRLIGSELYAHSSLSTLKFLKGVGEVALEGPDSHLLRVPTDFDDYLKVAEDPVLLNIIAEAYKSGSYKDVRCLRIFRKIPVSHPFHQPKLMNPEFQLKGNLMLVRVYCAIRVDDGLAVSNAWNTPYVGGHHCLLLKNINNMSRHRPYSNSVAILQGSGSGKSRMVHEQSALVFTLPFNLRAQSDSKDIAYPPPDHEIRNYFDWQAPNSSEGQTRYLHFLGQLFQVVSNELLALFSEKLPSYAALAEAWRNHLDNQENRTRIYRTTIAQCSSENLVQLQNKHPTPDGAFDTPLVYATSEEAKAELRHLLLAIDNCCNSMEGYQCNNVKLMLYFDDSHVLADKKILNDHDGKDMYDVLCSCFTFFLSFPIFIIFLSTNSDISEFAPQGSLARSARARKNADALQAPITETPFDCCPTFPLEPGKLKLTDLYEIEFMAQFGRPMFWTLLAGAANRKDEILSGIVDLARSKLICSQDISAKFIETTSASTAVLDVLLNLDFEPRREAARSRQARLVASHMRTAFSIPKDHEYLRSGYPSEPLLAEAAARQMDQYQMWSSDVNITANILKDHFSSGLLNQGLRGEVVFRQLISEAYRRGVRKDHPSDSPPIFSKGCTLITFIKELFSKDYADQILNNAPDNLKSETKFAEAFKDAIVRFTHFGKMADDTGTTSHAMLAAFVQCMAIICWSSQDVVDILIPVLLVGTDLLQESAMSGFMCQLKRRKYKGSVAEYEINQNGIGFFPPHTEDARPYITLVAELGVQPRIHKHAELRVKIRERFQKSAKTLKTKSRSKAAPLVATTSKLFLPAQAEKIAHPRDTHPRYSIFAYGCSHTVYNVIKATDKPLYKFLLGARDFLDEHPRPDRDSLMAVRMMKSFWNVGPESYHWLKEPFLQEYKAFDDDHAGLIVGKCQDSSDESSE